MHGRPRHRLRITWAVTTCLIGLVLGNCSASRSGQARGEAAGFAALRAGDYATAREGFQALLRSGSTDARVQAGLLTALRETGDFQESSVWISRFRSAGGIAAAVELEAGRLAFATGNLEAAEKSYRLAAVPAAGNDQSIAIAAERELADLLEYTGRAQEASGIWQRMLDSYRAGTVRGSAALGEVAVAAWRKGYAHDAKNIFMDATSVEGADPVEIRALSDFGYLFLEKYNATDAIGCFRDCLQINQRYPAALVGMALAKKFESSAEVVEYARAALEVNPRFVGALNLLAQIQYEAENYDAGLAEVRRALEVNPRELEALSLEAVYHAARGNEAEFREVEQRVLRIHPSYGQLYYTLAEDLIRRRKYRESVIQNRKAVELSPTLWAAYAGLGINLMRIGELDEGRRMIERAFEGDPFNVWAFNTLDLLDQMDRFVRVQSKDFTFLLSREDEAVVAPYLMRVAEEAYASMVRRYQFTPKGPLQVEMFPDHGGFAVRTLGLPGLGALGVCFGNVVAMDSPRAQQPGAFNWGATLWHELAHVFTLQMTDHNIPRWFSEGLSVYEEHRGREGWGDDLTAGIVRAYKDGKLLAVKDFNSGLMRPRFPEQIAYTYYQTWLFCEMIDKEFGFDKLRQALTLFAAGKSGKEVFQLSLGWDENKIEEEYKRYLDGHIGELAARLTFAQQPTEPGAVARQRPEKAELAARLAANPEDFFALWQMGALLWREKDPRGAELHLKKARELFPQFIEPGNPYRLLGEIFTAEGREQEALDNYLAWARYDETITLPLLGAAEIYRKRGEWSNAAEVLERAVYAYPLLPEIHQMLGDATLETGDWPTAVAAYRALVGLNPPDPAAAYYGLARAWLGSGNRQEARRATLRALEIAPSFEKAQQLLLKLREVGP